MRLHKTGHIIADTVSDLIGELPDGDYKIAYGILRHGLFQRGRWFEVDKGFWGAAHYDGNYRISHKGTQPIYSAGAISEPSGQEFAPWKRQEGYALICPPTAHVCQFFGIDYTTWLMSVVRGCDSYKIRNKGDIAPIDWGSISKVITFNSTVGIEAVRRGIPCISSEEHSSIGSFTKIKGIDNYDREELFSFLYAHQFKLDDKNKIEAIISHYLEPKKECTRSTSDGMHEKQ